MEKIIGACIETTYARNPAGYGVLNYKAKPCLHHRYVYAMHHRISIEEIKGKIVRHRCDNPACVNPDHLLLGTQKDNIRDMIAKGRNVGFTSESKGNAKVTEDQVRSIRSRWRENINDLAKEFGISKSAAQRIQNGDTWKEVK